LIFKKFKFKLQNKVVANTITKNPFNNSLSIYNLS
jgi:hypothetical protein